MQRLLIAALLAVGLQAASPPGPTRFYIVSHFFSDDGFVAYRVTDVRPAGSDSIVRYSRIAPVKLECPQIIVQSVEARIRNTSPAELVKANNLCAIRPRALKSALKKYRQREGVFEAMSFGIVAQCGPKSIALALPVSQEVNLIALGKAHPEMARLWNLPQDLITPLFGTADRFNDRTPTDDAALQRAGASMVPELISGQYDSGLTLAVKGHVCCWKHPSFQSLLADYKGPIDASQFGLFPELLSAGKYHFRHYGPPIYPHLAAVARVQGEVELQLTVNSATGDVVGASVTSGHPLLKPSALEAAKQWRFSPQSITSDSVKVALDYSLQCRSMASALADIHR